jgi:hypothetical protein
MTQTAVSSDTLIGTFRRFGAFGPAYEVTGLAGKDAEKGLLLNVRVLDTGEDVQYPYSNALDDPEA